MKLNKNSALFAELMPKVLAKGDIVTYIDRWLDEHGAAGIYEVDDMEYKSTAKDVRHKHFHPSGDCLKCPRLLYWERDPEAVAMMDDSPDPKLNRIFKTGSAMHAMIQSWFSAMSPLDGYPDLVKNEYRIDDDVHSIGGFVDTVLKFPGEDAPVVIEIKTVNDYRFSTLTAPMPAHRWQVGCYIMELESPYGVVLYINKNDCSLKQFTVEPMDMSPVLMKWAKVRMAVEQGSPEGLDFGCDFSPNSRDFKYCPAKEFCKRRSGR